MEERYDSGNFDAYHYEICIIDELNDLVASNKGVNLLLAKLAQKARQSKLHLILGTQRPDAKDFSGGLRSNIPARIALKVAKSSDSRIILDEPGAENLLGKGDMLIKMPQYSQPKMAFGTYLSDDDIKNLLSD